MVADLDTLAAIFEARVRLAKEDEDTAVKTARQEWLDNKLWVWSNAVKQGSFLWFCDQFNLRPDAVRRAILGAQPC